MAADPTRLVDVRGLHPANAQGLVLAERGSGLLVTADLVLTAAHVVFDGDTPLSVRLRFPSTDQPVTGEVVWPRPRGDIDAALVRIQGPTPVSVGSQRVRWARFTGRQANQPVDATGYPVVMSDQGQRVAFQLSGHVNPQTAREAGRYLVKVDERPSDTGSPWSGMSGAALMSGATVVGVVVIDTPGFDRDELTAVPAARILADPKAQALLQAPAALASVELDTLLARTGVSAGHLSWAQLLRADEEVIDFLGRGHHLEQLLEWCQSDTIFDARLVVGPGGRGKTRLAHQLISRLQEYGGQRWLSGLLATNADSDRLAALTSTARDHAVLLVADYAESRVEQLDALLQAYRRADDPPPVRLLLLARDRGDWWTRLCDVHSDLLGEDDVVVLTPLHEPPDRAAAFRSSVDQFAKRLHASEPHADWPTMAAQVEAPDLSDPCFGDPLSLQLQALLSLIESGGAPVTVGPVEQRLLSHERQYWRTTIDAHALALSSRVRDQAVTVATLIGVRNRSAALTLLQRVPELTEPGRVADWLRSLYPTETSARYWGALQPDRLGEHLVGLVSRDDPEILGHLLGSDDVEELQDALVVIGRAMAHQDHLAEQVRALAATGRTAIVKAIDQAARRVADPLPLQRALPESLRSGHYRLDPDSYGGALESQWASSSTPERLYELGRGVGENPFSSSNAFHPTAADMHGAPAGHAELRGRHAERQATEAYEAGNLVRAEQEFRLAALHFSDPKVDAQHRIRVDLARASVLNDQRSYDAALSLIDDVVARVRIQVEQGTLEPDVLGRGLDLYSAVLAETGRMDAAISSAYDASSVLRDYAERVPTDEAKRDAAKVTSNLAGLMHRSGRVDEAEKWALEALSALEALALQQGLGLSDDTYGRALLNRARIVAVQGQPELALDLQQRATDEFERIANLGQPAAMAPELAAAAEMRCGVAVELGRLAEARSAGKRAVELYTQLAERVPAFAVDLARAHLALAEVHIAMGQGPRALELAQRGVRLLREEADEDRGESSARRRRQHLEWRAIETQRRAQQLAWQW